MVIHQKMTYEANPFGASVVVSVKLIGNNRCVHLSGVHFF